MEIAAVPSVRIRVVDDMPPASDQPCVLYWMIAARRLADNFALQRAAWWAAELHRPLLVLETMRCDYPWASDRIHTCVLQGMQDNARDAADAGITYLAHVERHPGESDALVHELAAHAAVVVSDDYPTFVLPEMIDTAGRTLRRRFEAVDSNGLVPMRAADRAYPTAYAFRRYLQKVLPGALDAVPMPQVWRALPRRAAPLPPLDRWTLFDASATSDLSSTVARLPIDHAVAASQVVRGGARAAAARLDTFLSTGLSRYHEDRNHPDLDASSRLSPWLHFGHLSVHRIFAELMSREGWTRRRLAPGPIGRREGWWNVGVAAEAFLDECVTWREVGFNFCALRADHARYESLPDWARASLDTHASDPRDHVYTPDQFARAATHDPLWNAAQTQLAREGRLHNYLRMLWGKKILEWSPTPREALATMVDLNNRYALDGRDPNSYSGIFWVMGRYDRPWAPRRPIYGVVRYMSSANTRRKLKLKRYLATYGDTGAAAPEPSHRGLLFDQ